MNKINKNRLVENFFQTEEKKIKILSIKDPIGDICVGMVLLNPEFLDNILDRGIKSRYQENSLVFLTDLKNLIISKNRFNIGKLVNGKIVEDEDLSKINSIFESINFNIEKDWNKLINYRNSARSIIDKLIPDEKLDSKNIKNIYWNINPTKDFSENLILETNDNIQYSLFLNKNLGLSKTSSFNKLADDIVGNELENIWNEDYLPKWNKMIQIWVKTLHKNSNKNIQIHIEKFIQPERMDNLGYFEYFSIQNQDTRYKRLGEYIKEFDKNIIYLSDLMSLIWKNRESCFMDSELVYRTWMRAKITLLNSKILENILTKSIINNTKNSVKKLEDGFKLANGNIKMKFMKTLVEKMGCSERDVYYISGNGDSFYHLPRREFFRKNYNNLDIKFDYHVKMVMNEKKEDENDFIIKIKLEFNGEPLINCNIHVKFSGGEMSEKLTAKYKFEPVSDFNLKIKSMDI